VWSNGFELLWTDVEVDPGAEGDIPVGAGFLFLVFSRVELDYTDDPVRPTRGPAFRIRAEFAPDFISQSQYILGEVAGIYHHRIVRGVYLAPRLRVGLSRPLFGTESLLPNRRFYSGGSSSQRGFRRRQLGPLDANGDPLGGEVVGEASLDLRFPLFKILKGAAFVDAGQVWSTLEDVAFNQIEVAVGPGLWLDTPIGPFRFDYGIRLTNLSPEPKTAYHLSIGFTF
jgi:outer membrane translocation and assembly module TamA